MDKELKETKDWILMFLSQHSKSKWYSLKYLAAAKANTSVKGPLGLALQELHQEHKIKQRINELEFEYAVSDEE